MDRYKTKYLDNEEKELIETIGKLDTKTLPRPSKKEQKLFKEASKNFIKKETKMNIRIDPFELNKIKERAKKEGLKYSAFVKSVMHKYITGQLVEKKRLNK
jgi:predicted DNA binding CopG/RHH family protein